tara:strand:- start:152 stop:895 length:744 start_codon:yes stop_codon:yes gene_type:complete
MDDELDRSSIQEYRKTGDIRVRNKIIERYLPFVKSQAMRFFKNSPVFVELDELVSFGIFGLIRGINDYDLNHPSKAKLITYLTPKIRSAICGGLEKYNPISRKVWKKHQNLENAVDQLTSELRRKPYEDEIRKKLKLSKKEFAKAMKHIPYFCSLDFPCPYSNGSDREETWANVLDSEEVGHEEVIEEKDFVESVLKKLPENERLVLTLYYLKDFNFSEISGVLGRSKQRAQQIHNSALEMVRENCD